MAKSANITKTTLLLFPNIAKKSKKTGEIPLYLRLYHLKRKTERNLNKYVTEGELSLWNDKLMLLDKRDSKVNKSLSAIQTAFGELSDKLTLVNYTTEEIINHLLKDEKNSIDNSVSEETKNLPSCKNFAMDYYKNNIKNNPNQAFGTKQNYMNAINHLLNFLRENGKPDLPVNDFKPILALDFKSYLMNANPDYSKKSQSAETVKGNITKMKTIFEHAVAAELILANPFSKVKCAYTRNNKPKLNDAQIQQLINSSLELSVLDYYRDLFLFSTLTGLSFGDVTSLTWDCFEGSIEGKLFISSRRKKTKVLFEMYLPDLAQSILRKYKDHPECKITQKILPVKSNQKTNDYLKILAAQLKINFNLTFHISRHTFRRIIRDSGIVDNLERQTLMGHSTLNDIDATYYSVERSKLLEAKQKIDTFISKIIRNEKN